MDTHTFVWWSENARRLSDKVMALCEDTTNGLYLSLASLWEMQIKIQLGKLTLARPLRQLIQA
jgi:PIN domain nuclease of toxin-antitoxin system